jgi:hypothetical protein
VAGCSSNKSNPGASSSAAPAAAGPQVIVDGQKQNITGQVSCTAAGDNTNIGIGDATNGVVRKSAVLPMRVPALALWAMARRQHRRSGAGAGMTAHLGAARRPIGTARRLRVAGTVRRLPAAGTAGGTTTARRRSRTGRFRPVRLQHLDGDPDLQLRLRRLGLLVLRCLGSAVLSPDSGVSRRPSTRTVETSRACSSTAAGSHGEVGSNFVANGCSA